MRRNRADMGIATRHGYTHALMIEEGKGEIMLQLTINQRRIMWSSEHVRIQATGEHRHHGPAGMEQVA